MGVTKFCQSCSMPLDAEKVKGTEKNNSKSNEYCIYCYENGVFKDPNITIDEMEENIKIQMNKQRLPGNLIEKSLNLLPLLNRWKNKETVS